MIEIFILSLVKSVRYLGLLSGMFVLFYLFEQAIIVYGLPGGQAPALLWGVFNLAALFGIAPYVIRLIFTGKNGAYPRQSIAPL